MAKPILVLNGPNLNLLGAREPDIYGAATLADIEAMCAEAASRAGFDIDFRQTNREGELIDWVQAAREGASGLVINPAGYGHTSIALLDALRTLTIPIVECHLSNPAAREGFRRRSYVSPAASGVISGFGAASYRLAITAVAGLIGGGAAAGDSNAASRAAP